MPAHGGLSELFPDHDCAARFCYLQDHHTKVLKLYEETTLHVHIQKKQMRKNLHYMHTHSEIAIAKTFAFLGIRNLLMFDKQLLVGFMKMLSRSNSW